MKPIGYRALLAALATALLAAGGCVNKEKEQLADLQAQYNELATQKQDLQAKLAASKAHEMELESQLAQVGSKDSDVQRRDQEIARLQAELKERAAAGKAQAGGWDVGKFADRVSVGTDILFASGKATLTASGKAALDKIVADLRKTYAGLPVRVYGYTDNDPIKKSKNLWQDNLDLSANRAMAVTRYLIEKGIAAETVETVAMGATHYVAKNDTSADKAKNRRVEIVVIKS